MAIQKRTNPSGKTAWRVRIFVDGRYMSVGTFPTRTEARRAEADAIDHHRIPTADSITVQDWRALWLRTDRWRESTREWHTERTAAFAREYGTLPLARVTPALAATWAVNNRSTIQSLSSMWTAAHERRLARDNPWRGLMPARRPRIEPGWFVHEDLERLIAAAHEAWPGVYGKMAAALVVTGAYTGMRPGELAGLYWEDLDPATGRIWVRRQAESRTRKMTAPKNGRERSSIYPDIVAEHLARMDRLDDQRVFTGPSGGILFGPLRNRVWNPIRVLAGRHDMRMHELRHYTATLLMEHGLSSSDVAAQLGHVDGGRLVEQTYSHHRADPALDRVAETIGRVVAANHKEAS